MQIELTVIEGAPECWLTIDALYGDGLRGIAVGAELVVLTWLDRAGRDVLVVHPRGDSRDRRRASS